MQLDEIREFLDDASLAQSRLAAWGLHDTARGHANLVRMAEARVTLDLLADMCGQLSEQLPMLSDPDMALNNLERFVTAARSPLALASLFERDRESLPVLLQIFSVSQHLSDLLITDSESYDLLRVTEGQPVNRDTLVEEFRSEIAALGDNAAVMGELRRFKRRETLRICYGDLIRGQPLLTVTAQISNLADAIVEAAVLAAWRKVEARRGAPRSPQGELARFVVLGMGKLGGVELNYSSDIDLILLYDTDGVTDGARSQTNAEFFDAVARELVRLLTEPTELGYAYRVDLRLRPEGEQGPKVHSQEQALHYYDSRGRTWERQAYVKARPVAGDLEFGREFLARLEPWIYRRYLGLADITGIKALKRRIEQRAIREGSDSRNVKTGRGGIRDIEFAIQFLQLLNGCDLPEVRTGNTLLAIAQLEAVGCLTPQERALLEANYSFLRKVEHRLQIMFDLQTHELPASPHELRKVAIRSGFPDRPSAPALEAFQDNYQRVTRENRRILDHLLHDAFTDDTKSEPEVDLVLHPDPPAARIEEVLSRHGFRDARQAYLRLMALATEPIPFLSTRRCRHFLAAIAPRLLAEIAKTPDPDSTLVSLEKVSDSLGGKGALWELFSFNAPTLKLYVDLCATSPYLSSILISNPGMIDELMDSLLLDKLPTLDSLRATLGDLCRGAEDLDPILHSFKNAQQLRVGVRDILGKDDVQATTGALSDVARVCWEQIIEREYGKLTPRLGEPTVGEGARQGERCELIVLAMGKFGGGELNYYSDLDVVFLYEAEGSTVAQSRRANTTSNAHFFSELGQRIIKVATYLGPFGRLYEVDARLRPTGRSGALATSLAEFSRYFASGDGQLWERQALCKARVVHGSPRVQQAAVRAINAAVFGTPFTDDDLGRIGDMRRRLEETAGPNNLKRGAGGLVDIEFLTQARQLKHGADNHALRIPNTILALAALHEAGCLATDDYKTLSESYRFLRKIESRLRLMYASATNDLPSDPDELSRLARGLDVADGDALLAACRGYTQQVRATWLRYFGAR